MTLLNWELKPDQVLIFSDTLCLDGEDHRARGFVTKVYPAAHIGAVITGTGSVEVVTQFFIRALNCVANDLVHLSEYAPGILREIWKEYQDLFPGGSTTTTIYTFGLSKVDGRFTGFAYRSTADFEAEQLPTGMAIKPATALEEAKVADSLEALIGVARKQQEHDRGLPRMERVGIGGELWLYILEKSKSGAASIHIHCIEQMKHYDKDREISLAKLPANAQHPRAADALASDP